jgi:hypothetical protein
MNYISITSQNDLDVLLDLLRNNETFVREAYYQSNSYLTEDAIIAPESMGNLSLVILGADSEFYGAHVIFETVSAFSFFLKYDLTPLGKYTSSEIEIYLIENMGLIRAKSLRYVIFDEPFIGDESWIFSRKPV